MVAGKNSDVASKKLNLFLLDKPLELSPFDYIKLAIKTCSFQKLLKNSKVGQYNRIEKCLKEVVKLDVETCSLKELENVFGIGPKTARFFLSNTRKDYDCAVLDTHILKWLNKNGVDAPKATPSGILYLTLEKTYIRLVRSIYKGMTLPEIDTLIWSKESGRI
jgi:thermostable 8-oxoguanine DNA glycosylase